MITALTLTLVPPTFHPCSTAPTFLWFGAGNWCDPLPWFTPLLTTGPKTPIQTVAPPVPPPYITSMELWCTPLLFEASCPIYPRPSASAWYSAVLPESHRPFDPWNAPGIWTMPSPPTARPPPSRTRRTLFPPNSLTYPRLFIVSESPYTYRICKSVCVSASATPAWESYSGRTVGEASGPLLGSWFLPSNDST